jgi:acetyl-CoA C-acetyltransferase
MSRGGYLSQTQRFGARMGDSTMSDMMVGALTDPFGRMHMGVTAENVAAQFGISRADQDALALESHRRAAQAQDKGYFNEQIVPVVIKTRKGEVEFKIDEHPRRDVTAENLAGLRAVFIKENGTVTAGNASGINDGAAAVLMMSGDAVKSSGAKPLARLVAYAHAGVDPKIMGIGPVPATQAVLKRAGLTIEQMDVIEANEAFAAQACAVAKELKLDSARLNPNGSGISLGHPIGATGAIVTTKAIYELHRTGGRYALVTMCIGGGQGIAAIFERA